MFKKLWNFNLLYILFLAFSALQTAVFYFISKPFFYASAALFLVLAIFAIIRIHTVKKRVTELIGAINDDNDNTISNALSNFSIPVLIASENDEIIWYNERFVETVNDSADALIGENLFEILGENGNEELKKSKYTTISYANKIFDVYETEHTLNSVTQRIICFIDLTTLRKTASEYKLSRPIVALIAIDNLDDLALNMRDGERSSIISKIQTVLDDWFATVNGISRKISGERYLFVFEERDLISFTANKFDILNQIRSIDFGNRGRATISIGIGCGNTFRECEEQASQALDMALGRGGDQVAIKKRDNSFQFFGGISGGNEKRTRVRTRIVASALLELINSSEQVVLMGHKFADLDCYGAAYALCSVIRKFTDTPAVIAMEQKNALVNPLFDRITELGADLMVADYRSIEQLLTKNTLLIVLDTHRLQLLEYEDVLNKAGTVVVIDHHRKSVDHISNAVIFYHESSASSASEMVCELLQYISESAVGKAEAEALLAGIVLDTRNYCMNTGVRTFEASAFLRRRGADPIAVKKMFSDSIEHHKLKTSIISTAEQFGKYAVAINNNLELSPEQSRIISSQAADELLNISGVKASFVMSQLQGVINISARSYGDVNVQLIMENLGGGGHRTMAACQLKDIDFEKSKQLLLNAISKNEEDN